MASRRVAEVRSSEAAMTRAVLPMLALFCSAALAGEGAGPYSFTLSGKAFDERCVNLDAGQSIRYRFKASAPVDFNIHYHRGEEVVFPVRKAELLSKRTDKTQLVEQGLILGFLLKSDNLLFIVQMEDPKSRSSLTFYREDRHGHVCACFQVLP